MKKKSTIASVYILLCIIYLFIKLVYPGSFFSRILKIVIVLISIYYFFSVLFQEKHPRLFNYTAILVCVFCSYGLSLLYSQYNDSILTYNLNILSSFLPTFAFYSFIKKGLLSDKQLFYVLLVYLVIITYSYFLHESIILANSKRDEQTNNKGYLFLEILPFIMLFDKKKVFQFLIMAYCSVFIIMSMKRGPILIGALCLFFFIINSLQNKKGHLKIGNIVLIAIIVVVIYYFVGYMFATSDLFNKRLEYTMEGNSSGRDELYSTALSAFQNEQRLLPILFGHGAFSTLTLMGQAAHSDWIEILYCNGLFGATIFLLYIVALYKTWRNTKADKRLHLIIGSCLLIFFMRSIFSMTFNYHSMSEYFCMALGYALANAERECLI